jgi:hypothetical protein
MGRVRAVTIGLPGEIRWPPVIKEEPAVTAILDFHLDLENSLPPRPVWLCRKIRWRVDDPSQRLRQLQPIILNVMQRLVELET